MKKICFILVCSLLISFFVGCENSMSKEQQTIKVKESNIKYEKLEGDNEMNSISQINSQQVNSIIDLSNRVLLYGTYFTKSIKEIYELAPFAQIRYLFTENSEDYYYTIYRIDNGYLLTFFKGEKDCSKYDLKLDLAIVTHRLFSTNDFENLTVNKSTIDDVIKIDILSKTKNTDYFKATSEKIYYKYSIHMTDFGVILIGYNNEKIPIIKSITEVNNNLISNINENDKKLLIKGE